MLAYFAIISNSWAAIKLLLFDDFSVFGAALMRGGENYFFLFPQSNKSFASFMCEIEARKNTYAPTKVRLDYFVHFFLYSFQSSQNEGEPCIWAYLICSVKNRAWFASVNLGLVCARIQWKLFSAIVVSPSIFSVCCVDYCFVFVLCKTH